MHLVGEVAFHQDIAGEELALGVDLAAAAHLDDLFGRHEDLVEKFGKTALGDLFLDGGGELVLEILIGVNDVPAL